MTIFARDHIEDPLEDLGSVKQLMELFTVISRRDYKSTVQELVALFDENMSLLQSSSDNRVLWVEWKRCFIKILKYFHLFEFFE